MREVRQTPGCAGSAAQHREPEQSPASGLAAALCGPVPCCPCASRPSLPWRPLAGLPRAPPRPLPRAAGRRAVGRAAAGRQPGSLCTTAAASGQEVAAGEHAAPACGDSAGCASRCLERRVSAGGGGRGLFGAGEERRGPERGDKVWLSRMERSGRTKAGTPSCRQRTRQP